MNKVLPPLPGKISCLLLACALGFTGAGCRTVPRPGTPEPRTGDEIVVAGQMFHTGTPVVLWMDPGGYDAYRVERRFSPIDRADWLHSAEDVSALHKPNRYTTRTRDLTPAEIEKIRGGGWDLALLQRVVDQFVIHFDVCGVSRTCFKVLQDARGLSVHFMLDIDGTVYQTLDLKESAQHATISNGRSVGIEIANMGAYSRREKNPLNDWYRHDPDGTTTITLPAAVGDGGVRTPGFVGHPRHPDIIDGKIQGTDLKQYDFTPEQYAALAHLTATLCTVFPKIQCRYPVDAEGKLIPKQLPAAELRAYEGVLGHYHIQTDKVDPGPAFDWDYVIGNAKKLMGGKVRAHASGLSPIVDDVSKGAGRDRD